jgi:hypothetical protein
MKEFSPAAIQAFRYWIQGYPNFYEPIVEEYFRIAGYQIVRRPARVTQRDIQKVITALFDGTRQVGPELNSQRLQQFLDRRKRMQPDLHLLKDGNHYLAELKSWGGFRTGSFDLATLRTEFLEKPENGVFLLLNSTEMASTVAGKILVVSSRSPQHDQVLALLQHSYQTNVQLLYLDEIFRTPQLAGFIDRQLRYLDAAVADIKQAFRWVEGGTT